MRFARLAVVLIAACSAVAPPPPSYSETRPIDPARLWVLAVNGGGSPQTNQSSHLGHLRALTEVLGRAGVARDRITVLSSDGEDPAPDLLVGREEATWHWLLERTARGTGVRPAPRLVSSVLPGHAARPATAASWRPGSSACRPGRSVIRSYERGYSPVRGLTLPAR